METITIPQQEITLSSYTSKKTGRDVTLTNFGCEHKGKLLMPCQAFGDKKALLEEAMAGKKPVEVESVQHNTQFNRYDVKFREGAGSGAQYRQQFGARPFVPAGYKGQPVPFDTWCSTTTDVLVQAVQSIRVATMKHGNHPHLEVSADVIVQEARSLVAQYWMAVERNLTFPAGFEPKAAPAEAAVTAQPAKPADTVVIGEADEQTYRDAMDRSVTPNEVDKVMAAIRSDSVLTEDAKVELLGQCLQRKRMLTVQ